MSLNYVTLTVDVYDGQGNVPISGTATFTPSAVLTDTTNDQIIAQLPVTVSFKPTGVPTVRLLATDNATALPAGWAWSVTFSSTSMPAAFSFFLPFSGGASQNLADLAAVATPSALLGSTAGGVSVYPSGDTTGVTDQANITAAEALGRTIYFGAGTFWVTGLVKQAGTIWQGSGRFATVIKLANSANADVIKGANFSTLTLSGSTTGGIGGWGIRDLAIDGNKANQSGTSYGLRVFAYEFDLTRVSIRNCLTDGLYTEWGDFGGAGLADSTEEATYTGLMIHDNGGHGWHNRGPHDSRAYDITIFSNGSGSYGYWAEANNATTVAAGSNGVNVSTFAGAGTLNVATTLGYPTASISSAQGALSVATSGTTAVITYTGVTATSFTGCTTVSGSGTLSTGGAVSAQGGKYSAAMTLLYGAHVHGNPLWDYVLDCGAHLIDCVGEIAQDGGGMVLVRGSNVTVTSGLYVIYAGFSPLGCGIQIGDTTNAAAGLRVDTSLNGFTGADAAHAAINIVNDAGSNSVDALIYQPTGTAVFGTPNQNSRYRVVSAGASLAGNAANSIYQDLAIARVFVGASSLNAWRLTPAGANDFVNLNASNTRFEFVNGILTRWYSGNYSSATVEVDGAKGHINFPSSTAPSAAANAAAIGSSGNGASVTVTGNDARGTITVVTASSGIGSFPATVATMTFATVYSATPRVQVTPINGPSAAVLPYGQGISTSQFLLGFNGAPATSTTYTYAYSVDG